ncbi:Z1 domain-containing protein [Glutamicibacter sp. BW78]|uniref:Z1 domain-containing protein n=1 Tax=Glutamicibacter sp. BW78 TaxID=2024403 RepID=UPI00117A7F80|nr:Z1 domain-containing protein [Glutamicibacter sp. BW78]
MSELTLQAEAALQQIQLMTMAGKSPEEAIWLLHSLKIDPEVVEQASDAYFKLVEAIYTPGMGDGHVIQNPEWKPWYDGGTFANGTWEALKEHLEGNPKWAHTVESLDATSQAVVARCADPHQARSSVRGLVLGYVQSGKTANFTATIAKAADAGYRLFIVLSGVHNSLRRQTQMRLEGQIVGLDPVNWISLTSAQSDFGNPVQALPLMAGSKLNLLAVVKKNVTRLTKLVEWLQLAHEKGALNDCPILIIDDEADQASVNTAKDAELNTSVIHAKLKQLLDFPKVTYIGYSATPFANVLANPKDVDGIYPKDFIYSLPKPSGYFGAEELFGRAVTEEEEQDEDRVNVIRYVPDDESAGYVVSSKVPYSPSVSKSLAAAIRWFVMATAARRVRSGEVAHSSMLVHTTFRVEPQLQFVPVIKKHLKALAAQWSSGDVEEWEEQWNQETSAEPAENHGLRTIGFGDMSRTVSDVLADIHVLADNGVSTDRLIYGDEPATVIAVGGNTLSRGLTLEGLISSFFLRNTTMYDSALQMGRWFGYRPGYADLPRIWTTATMAEDFRFLSDLETSIRQDIEAYGDEKISPSNFAVRLMLHPKMQVTSRLKMQFAIPAEASFSGATPQTTYFSHLSETTVADNWSAAENLIGALGTDSAVHEQFDSGTLIARHVPVDLVLTFLDDYAFHPNSEMGHGVLAKYIRAQLEHSYLESWNVAVIGRANPNEGKQATLGRWTFNPFSRSRVVPASGDYPIQTAYLKAITSTSDFSVDLPVSPKTSAKIRDARDQSASPLLIVYPIDKTSKPKKDEPSGTRKNERRIALDAVGNLVGVALSLPSAAPRSLPTDMIHVEVPEKMAKSTVASDQDELGDSLPYEDTEGFLDEVSLDA